MLAAVSSRRALSRCAGMIRAISPSRLGHQTAEPFSARDEKGLSAKLAATILDRSLHEVASRVIAEGRIALPSAVDCQRDRSRRHNEKYPPDAIRQQPLGFTVPETERYSANCHVREAVFSQRIPRADSNEKSSACEYSSTSELIP